MSDLNLPRHIIDRVERRWATHLAADAQGWKSRHKERPQVRDVVSKSGRRVPVQVRSRLAFTSAVHLP